MAAGQVLFVGLVCFVTWLLLDARDLYDSALSSPLGARRTVAVAVLRPIARASAAVGLDRIGRGADRALGRDGTPGGSVVAVGQVRVAGPTPSPERLPRVTPPSTTSTAAPAPPPRPTRAAGPPPLAQPGPGRPITLLEVGDSIGEDLGYGLGDVLASDAYVRVVQDAVGSTGLAAIGYYDWPAQLEVELARYHPAIVVVMLGGNDAQSFDVGTRYIGFGTAAWQRVYGARVARMMSEATASGAHVLWVGMPVMSPAATLSNAAMVTENALFAAEARRHAGVAFLSTWRLLATPAGAYSQYLPNGSGSLVQVRDDDGIHIDAPGGTDLLGRAAVAAMERAWRVRL
ncbi:MAG TPA: DUF459 domain-containing protein [Acidimicrobiales bacterium]|nr:DUF459 domain-containing protein [Acidimicrobiales bacterium]